MRNLGNRIQAIRSAKKITQEDLASRIDKSPHFISDIERGTKKPNIVTLIDILTTLNVTPNEMFCDFIDIEGQEITDIIKIFTELSNVDRDFLFKFIKDYKAFIDTKNN